MLLFFSRPLGNQRGNRICPGCQKPAATAGKVCRKLLFGCQPPGAQCSVRSYEPIKSHPWVKVKFLHEFCRNCHLVFSSKSCNHGETLIKENEMSRVGRIS